MSDPRPFHGLEIAAGAAVYEGRPIALSGKELKLLDILMRHDPRPVSFEEMLGHLYGAPDEPEPRIVGVFGRKLGARLHAATGGMITITGDRGDRLALSVFDPDPPRFPTAAARRA